MDRSKSMCLSWDGDSQGIMGAQTTGSRSATAVRTARTSGQKCKVYPGEEVSVYVYECVHACVCVEAVCARVCTCVCGGGVSQGLGTGGGAPREDAGAQRRWGSQHRRARTEISSDAQASEAGAPLTAGFSPPDVSKRDQGQSLCPRQLRSTEGPLEDTVRVPPGSRWPFLAACARARPRARPRSPAPAALRDLPSVSPAGDKLSCLDGAVSWPHKPETCSPISEQLSECFILICSRRGDKPQPEMYAGMGFPGPITKILMLFRDASFKYPTADVGRTEGSCSCHVTGTESRRGSGCSPWSCFPSVARGTGGPSRDLHSRKCPHTLL